MGARIYKNLQTAVADCSLVVGTGSRLRNQYRDAPVQPEALPLLLSGKRRVSDRAKWALVFGGERHGMLKKQVELCDLCLEIPWRSYHSYNLSQAVAVSLYGIFTTGLRLDRLQSTAGKGNQDDNVGTSDDSKAIQASLLTASLSDNRGGSSLLSPLSCASCCCSSSSSFSFSSSSSSTQHSTLHHNSPSPADGAPKAHMEKLLRYCVDTLTSFQYGPLVGTDERRAVYISGLRELMARYHFSGHGQPALPSHPLFIYLSLLFFFFLLCIIVPGIYLLI